MEKKLWFLFLVKWLFEVNIEKNKKEKSEFFSFFYTKIALVPIVKKTIIKKK